MTKTISRRRRILTAAAAFTALSSCNSDSVPSAASSITSATDSAHKRYSLEVWEEQLVGGLGSHAAIVIRDRTQDDIFVMQGLATDRATAAVKPVGTSGSDDIYAYAQIFDSKLFPEDRRKWRATLLETDNGTDVVSRMTAMLHAAGKINKGHYAYQLFSSSRLAGHEAYNSNATARTLLKAAGLEAKTVTFGGFAPGWNDLVPIGYKRDLARIRRGVKATAQARILDLTIKLAGRVNARGMLENPENAVDLATAYATGIYVGKFIEAMDYDGEQARRNAQITKYQRLPKCDEISAPEYPSWDVSRIPNTTKALYGENVTDEYRAPYGAESPNSTSYTVVTDPDAGLSCRTERSVPRRSQLLEMAKVAVENDKFMAEEARQQPARAVSYGKPKVKVRLNL